MKLLSQKVPSLVAGALCRGVGWRVDTFSKSQQRGKNKNSGGSQRKGHHLCGDLCGEMGKSGGRGVGGLGKDLPHRDGGLASRQGTSRERCGGR